MQDLSGLRRQVNIALVGVPGPVSGTYALIGIRVSLVCDPPFTVTRETYCYTWLELSSSERGYSYQFQYSVL